MNVSRIQVAPADTCVECNAQDDTPHITSGRTMLLVEVGGDRFQLCTRHGTKLREDLTVALWPVDAERG